MVSDLLDRGLIVGLREVNENVSGRRLAVVAYDYLGGSRRRAAAPRNRDNLHIQLRERRDKSAADESGRARNHDFHLWCALPESVAGILSLPGAEASTRRFP